MIPLGVLASSYVAPAGGGGLDVSYLGYVSDTNDAAAYTFSSVDLGAAATDRTIIVHVHQRNSISITAVSIGGVSATIDVAASGDNSGDHAIVRAAVPTGTTGDIVVTLASVALGCVVHVYRVTGGTVQVDDTATAYGGSSGTSGGTVTVTAVAGGWVHAAAYGRHSSSQSCTFTGTAGLSEDYDHYLGSGIPSVAGGRASIAAAGDVTVTATWTSVFYARLAAVAYSIA